MCIPSGAFASLRYRSLDGLPKPLLCAVSGESCGTPPVPDAPRSRNQRENPSVLSQSFAGIHLSFQSIRSINPSINQFVPHLRDCSSAAAAASSSVPNQSETSLVRRPRALLARAIRTLSSCTGIKQHQFTFRSRCRSTVQTQKSFADRIWLRSVWVCARWHLMGFGRPGLWLIEKWLAVLRRLSLVDRFSVN